MKGKFLTALLIGIWLINYGQSIEMKKIGRSYQIPCKVNGLDLNFILDTGADNVSISLSEAINMINKGLLNKNDLLKTEYYRLANGEVVEGTKVILRTLVVGGLTLRNIEAAIIHTDNAPLLFGQSALERFGKVTIDYKNNKLHISEVKEIYVNPKESAISHFMEGNWKQSLGNYFGAIDEYSKAIQLNPLFFEAYYNRGLAKYEVDSYTSAIDDYMKAIEIYPSYSDVYNGLSAAKFMLEDYRGAIIACNKGIEVYKKNTVAYINRGRAKVNIGDINGAINDFNKAIELNPIEPNAYYGRALAKLKNEDYNGAITDYSKCIDLNPLSEDAILQRGMLYYANNKSNEALSDCNRVLELNPKKGSAYMLRAYIKNQKKDYKGAINDCSMAINLDPSNNYTLYHYRGLVKLSIGDIDGACHDWKNAKLLGNEDANYLIFKYCK
jgi:clan AA aspartic protease (TIGR02281 family)